MDSQINREPSLRERAQAGLARLVPQRWRSALDFLNGKQGLTLEEPLFKPVDLSRIEEKVSPDGKALTAEVVTVLGDILNPGRETVKIDKKFISSGGRSYTIEGNKGKRPFEDYIDGEDTTIQLDQASLSVRMEVPENSKLKSPIMDFTFIFEKPPEDTPYTIMGAATITDRDGTIPRSGHDIYAGYMYRQVLRHAKPEAVISEWPGDEGLDSNYTRLENAVKERYGASMDEATTEMIKKAADSTLAGNWIMSEGYKPSKVLGSTFEKTKTVIFIRSDLSDDFKVKLY